MHNKNAMKKICAIGLLLIFQMNHASQDASNQGYSKEVKCLFAGALIGVCSGSAMLAASATDCPGIIPIVEALSAVSAGACLGLGMNVLKYKHPKNNVGYLAPNALGLGALLGLSGATILVAENNSLGGLSGIIVAGIGGQCIGHCLGELHDAKVKNDVVRYAAKAPGLRENSQRKKVVSSNNKFAAGNDNNV
jgi:hypothetical protein